MQESYPKIPGTEVEIIVSPTRGRVRHALFDWDGTVSYMRDGWQDFMVPLMIEVLEACPRHESRKELQDIVIDFVDHLTGKQTIYQMMRLCEEVKKRGGTPVDPLEYKDEYNRRLGEHVSTRYAKIASGENESGDFLVPGAHRFLEAARSRGIHCYLASGTDEELINEDARLLGLSELFDGGIYGALKNYKDFSKEKVIRKIFAEFKLEGPELLVVGDGYVEIQNGRAVDAVTLALATVENNRFHMNDDKRRRLLGAGAHLMARDLSEGEAILRYLCDGSS